MLEKALVGNIRQGPLFLLGGVAAILAPLSEERGIPMYRMDCESAIFMEGSLDSSDLRITTAKHQQFNSVVLNENFLSQEWANWQRL